MSSLVSHYYLVFKPCRIDFTGWTFLGLRVICVSSCYVANFSFGFLLHISCFLYSGKNLTCLFHEPVATWETVTPGLERCDSLAGGSTGTRASRWIWVLLKVQYGLWVKGWSSHSFSPSRESSVLLGFFLFVFWCSCPISVCLYPHRSSTVGKPDTRKQRAPHSFIVYDGIR